MPASALAQTGQRLLVPLFDKEATTPLIPLLDKEGSKGGFVSEDLVNKGDKELLVQFCFIFQVLFLNQYVMSTFCFSASLL